MSYLALDFSPAQTGKLQVADRAQAIVKAREAGLE